MPSEIVMTRVVISIINFTFRVLWLVLSTHSCPKLPHCDTNFVVKEFAEFHSLEFFHLKTLLFG